MMSEEEIRLVMMMWEAAHKAMVALDDREGAQLAAGYVGALELVLRG